MFIKPQVAASRDTKMFIDEDLLYGIIVNAG